MLSVLVFFPSHLGWCGVAVFFVVSGFCIHLSYTQTARPSWQAFYIRRFFRLYPAYLIALLFFALVFPWSRLTFNKLIYWGQLVSHLLLCHNLSDFFVFSIAGSFWSIAVEVQLYLLFPLLLLFVRRYSFRRALVALAVVEVSLHLISILVFEIRGQGSPAWLRTSPFFFWFSWAVGAAIADAYLNRKPLPFTRIHPVPWLVLAILTSAWPSHELTFTLFALCTASVLSRSLSAGAVGEIGPYWRRFLQRTGAYSYSIYLIHGPIMIMLMELYEAWFPDIRNQPFLLFPAALSSWLMIFPLSALMYRWVERPGIALGKRLFKARTHRASDRLTTAASTM
jgi:peptidoglycan/LPS O-acetylase OafA/YrhL